MTPRCARPTTVAEASRALVDGGWGAKVMAGGTALMLMMKHGLVAPELVVSLDRVGDPGLRRIALEGQRLRIGGLVTLADVAGSPLVRAHAPALAHACAVVGNVRIRGVATIAGNLAEADYASDPPAVLVALGASAVVDGPGGRRETPVGDLITGFYSTTLGTGEIITHVMVPVPRQRAAGRYTKFRSRSSEDRPCIGVAAHVRYDGAEVDGLAVVLGAVAARPHVVPDTDSIGRGTRLEDEVIARVASRAAETLEPMDDHRGSAWYRRQVSVALVRRTLVALRETEGA